MPKKKKTSASPRQSEQLRTPCVERPTTYFMGRMWDVAELSYSAHHYVPIIPDGTVIVQTCGEILCVNPDHLKAVGGAASQNNTPVTQTCGERLCENPEHGPGYATQGKRTKGKRTG